jgi:hypothetical protein
VLAELMATAKSSPAATVVQVVPAAICPGVLVLALLPLPSWPFALPPHVQSERSVAMAAMKFDPAATMFHVELPTWVGLFSPVFEPLPSWPLPSPPHVQRVLSDFTAAEKLDPAAIVSALAPDTQARTSSTQMKADMILDLKDMATPAWVKTLPPILYRVSGPGGYKSFQGTALLTV